MYLKLLSTAAVVLILIFFYSFNAISENSDIISTKKKQLYPQEAPKIEQSTKPQLTVNTLNDLELEKKRIEIEKLKNEIRTNDLSPWLQSGTLVAALLAAAISIWSALRAQKQQNMTLKAQINQQQKDRISELLKELGSDQIPVKVAALHALSEYETALPFIVNILKIESDSGVISVAITALTKNVDRSLPLLLEQTNVIHQNQLDVALKLISLGLDRKKIANELNIDNAELLEWYEKNRGRRIIQLIETRINTLTKLNNESNVKTIESEKSKLLSEWLQINRGLHNIISGIEALIRISVKYGTKQNLNGAYLNSLMADNLDFSGWSFTNSILSNASFVGSICENTDFSGVTAINASFQKSKINHSRFCDANLKHCDFRSIEAKNSSFTNARLFSINFSNANLRQSDFTNARIADIFFRNCHLDKSNCVGTTFYNTDMIACDASDSILSEAKISNTKFHTSKFFRCDFSSSVFKKVDNIKCSFDSSNFVKSQLVNVKIEECKFTNTDFNMSEFIKVNTDESTCFSGTTWKNVKIKKCSEYLDQVTDKI